MNNVMQALKSVDQWSYKNNTRHDARVVLYAQGQPIRMNPE